ncbi:MAG: tetratricopeptide repeat protein [Porphyromonadaceae bacterium]|nr:tetratricopeptide repeat protein [Porphyromonadaceae bacterium]
MKRIYPVILVIALAGGMFSPVVAVAQKVDSKTERRMLREGNKSYKKEQYTQAEIDYRRSLDASPSSPMATYNIGNTLFRQEKYDEAARQYSQLVEKELPSDDKVKASENWYNLGNSLFMQEKYGESVEAYKNALRRNPDDHEARYNLRLAQLKQQEQQQNQENQQNQQQNQQNQQQNQDKNKNQQDNQDKDQNQDNQQQQQQQQDQQNQQNPDRQENQSADNGQPQQGNISPENAQQILDALQQDEKAVQEKVQKNLNEQRKRHKTDKEW